MLIMENTAITEIMTRAFTIKKKKMRLAIAISPPINIPYFTLL